MWVHSISACMAVKLRGRLTSSWKKPKITHLLQNPMFSINGVVFSICTEFKIIKVFHQKYHYLILSSERSYWQRELYIIYDVNVQAACVSIFKYVLVLKYLLEYLHFLFTSNLHASIFYSTIFINFNYWCKCSWSLKLSTVERGK